MLQKHGQVFILLVGLVYVYSVCPFLCAAFEQTFCRDASQKMLGLTTETGSTCCQRAEAGAGGEAETPSESGKLCCSKDLELVLPDGRYNTHESRESIKQALISILPISATLLVAPRESYQILPVPLTSTFFPNHSLSYRGPPYRLLHKEPFSF